MKYTLGHFTPDARILCGSCAGLEPDGELGHCTLVRVRCDGCGRAVVPEREDVARLALVKDALERIGRAARWEQTGGMNVALVLAPSGGTAYVFTDSEESVEPAYVLGIYRGGAWECGDPPDAQTTFVQPTDPAVMTAAREGR